MAVKNGSVAPDAIPEHLSGMFSDYWLDYSSYVILERAVPHLYDGLKPVQRRILHSMKDLDDGRYNKVANIVGHTMSYHPHGDTSIGDATVQLGQKDLLIDPQGNWGNVETGDRAAATRYIEARLTPFAKEVVFSPKVTEWKYSYDGRKKEPVTFPVKFPLLLAQGVEGIAVGLACKILPHNFNEIIDCSIDALRKKQFTLLPDFPTGGIADCRDYNDGIQGGKIRVRAKIVKESAKCLRIREIPFGTTTSSIIDSIISANDKGKIKIAKIDDNTAAHVQILVHLPAGTKADNAIKSLYAFTDCEVSISPNSCVIENNKPLIVGVSEILRRSAFRTKELLRQELEIRLGELEAKWHFMSLERIFISKRIYHRMEECKTWDEVIREIKKGLKPHIKKLKKKVTDDDIAALTEIKIKRISKYDLGNANKLLKEVEANIAEVKADLKQLTRYAVRFLKHLKEAYGKEKGRKTEISSFNKVDASEVVLSNEQLYANFKDGFIGLGLKKDSPVMTCSRIDDIIVFTREGKMVVTKVADKVFVGKDIIHMAIFKKDEDIAYNLIYRDGRVGSAYVKRFKVGGITRDKVYDLTKGQKSSRLFFFEVSMEDVRPVNVHLSDSCKARKKLFSFDLASVDVKGRGSAGNIVTKHSLSKVNRGPGPQK